MIEYHHSITTRTKVAVQNHFIVVDAAFAVVVTLIDILLCPFLPLIWPYISNYVV